jgi:formylglycine-generating enzyme required for sulfatase activity
MVSCALANVWMKYPDKPKEFCVGDTVQVGSYPAGASPYGALDMAGNVSEWVADWYDSGYYTDSPAKNPIGPETGSFYTMVGGEWVWEYGEYSIIRGGAWSSFQHDNRSFSRTGWGPDWGVYNFNGFRCAQSAP